jgi:PPOX class probable F420-dependent enzyme
LLPTGFGVGPEREAEMVKEELLDLGNDFLGKILEPELIQMIGETFGCRPSSVDVREPVLLVLDLHHAPSGSAKSATDIVVRSRRFDFPDREDVPMVKTGDVTTEFPESHRHLLEAQGVGALATVGPDGRPQVTAVWYLLDDDGLLKVSVKAHRQKIKNLSENPVATFLVIDPANPVRTLEIRATTQMSPDDDYDFAQRLGRKYDADLKSYDDPSDRRVVVTLHPEHVNPKD